MKLKKLLGNKAATLIELLTVICVIIILLKLIVPTISKAYDFAELSLLKSHTRNTSLINEAIRDDPDRDEIFMYMLTNTTKWVVIINISNYGTFKVPITIP